MPAVSSSLEKIPQNAPVSLALRPETIRHPDKRSKLEKDATCGLEKPMLLTLAGHRKYLCIGYLCKELGAD
jgi:hypothetical protein